MVDPATISLIIGGINWAMKFAAERAQLLEDAHAFDLTTEEIRARLAAINERYAASRKAWDDAGGQTT